MEPTFSVIIPTYNRAELVERTVRAFLAQEGPSFEIIVLDDGSTDGTFALLKAINHPRVGLHRQENRGLAAARNAGFALAKGEYVLFNDDDVVPQVGFLQAHLGLHHQLPNVAVVSRTYLPGELGQGPFMRYWRERAEGGVRGKPNAAVLGKGGYWFASLSVERESLPQPPFSDFRAYGWEEHELGLRLWAKGVQPRLATGARAAHLDAVRLDSMLEKLHSMGRMAWEFCRLHPSLEVAFWTGANPLSLAYKRRFYPWAKAQELLENRAWEATAEAFKNYSLVLEAAYTRGLLEGKP
ncbi:MAG: glycosyltransferase family 2 protein [Thermaceae bacterium]|nr:glycosyltransferase family 2 protein [Thermaceae bacterium]